MIWDNQIWGEGDTYGALPMPMVVPLQYIATHRHHVNLRCSGVPFNLALGTNYWSCESIPCMHILPGSLLALAAKASTASSTWSELVKVKAEKKNTGCGHALYCSRSEEAAAGAEAKAKLAKHAVHVHDRYATLQHEKLSMALACMRSSMVFSFLLDWIGLHIFLCSNHAKRRRQERRYRYRHY